MRKKQTPPSVTAPVEDISIIDVVQDNMSIYGKAVNEDRAIPSFQDGMKPVQRRVLWASNGLANSYVKTARLVGDVIGKFHPHSDTGCAAAVETIVHTETPTLIGEGNWGTFVDTAAAQRYTNVKLSAYGKTFLNSDYLQCVPYVPSYDGTAKEPLYLPALLPHIFLNYAEGIGVGLATCLPAFTPDSMLGVMIDVLNKPEKAKETLDPKALSRRLKFYFGWGMELQQGQLKNFHDWLIVGKGSLKFYCPIQSKDYAKRTIVISNYGPGIKLETDKGTGVIQKIKAWPFVQTVNSDKLTFEVVIKKGVTLLDFDKAAKKIEDLMTVSHSFSLNVTERILVDDDKAEGGKRPEVLFHHLPLPKLLWKWLKFRVDLESKVIDYRIGVTKEKIHRVRLLLHAIKHLDFLFDALRKKFNSKTELRDHVAAGLKISEDDADTIVNLQYHRLSSLDKADLTDELQKLKDAVADLRAQADAPQDNVVAMLTAYRKSFKVTQHTCLGLKQNTLG